MKRIAILLAAVGLGSGCVVSPCDSRSITVDWRFIDVHGNSELACDAPSLSAIIHDVDVYIDGTRVALAEPCTNYGIVFGGYSAGLHDVLVEGFDVSGNVIVRDQATVNLADCGDTTFPASPGEATLEILPTVCEAGTTWLFFRLSDETFSPPITTYEQLPGLTSPYTCLGGIVVPVAYGSYSLDAIEEGSSTAVTVFASKCSATLIDVPFASTTITENVILSGTAACF